MKDVCQRYDAMPPMPLIRSNSQPAENARKQMFRSPSEVLAMIEQGYHGKVVVAEWMGGIALGLTTVPVFMVQPLDVPTKCAETDAWTVAKEWMDMSNLSLIQTVCEEIVKRQCEIAYEF